VENVLETLQQLATFHRKQLGTTIIGITGTNGKTTTKELIAAVLQEKYNILYTKGNFNNHIGVPLTLLQLKPEHQLAVIEMGANHRGEIKMLSEITCPDYGIITNVGKAHLEGFGSFEGVMATKAELYEYIYLNGKEIFINKDNEYLIEMAKNAGFETSDRIHEYSLNTNDAVSFIYGQVSNCSPFLNLNCSIDIYETFIVNTQLIGAYNAENVLAAVAIGQYFGVDSNKIKHGLEKYVPQNNRSQLTVTESNKLVVDAYNANPTSLNAAILNFAQMDVSNKTLILGDMLELGEQSDIEHQNIIDLLQQNHMNNVLLVGPEFKKAHHNFECFDNVNNLIDYLQEKPIKGHYILIKGSRGIKLEKVVPIL
jgi:UDP-N-acetylmuramoyl-tripeptide--D-alanyl-D-alanine ligase